MPGENSGNMNTTKKTPSAANLREDRVSNASNYVTTSAGNKLSASSANVREDRVSYTSNYVPPVSKTVVETNNKDWKTYREGEREDPPKKVPEPIFNPIPFSGSPEVIFTPTVAAIPVTLPPPPPPPPTTYKVKVATPEIILFDDETLPIETLTDILFEDIGGQELLSMSRHDIVSGNYIPNQLIKNLTSLNQEFSSKRLLSLQNTSDKYFSNFGIKLENKIPFVGNGLNGENVYLDESQNVIIELVNLDIDEQVEVQLSIGGTMYTIMLGVVES
jgi:hypothetical protein